MEKFDKFYCDFEFAQTADEKSKLLQLGTQSDWNGNSKVGFLHSRNLA